MENSRKAQTSLLGIINPEELTEVKACFVPHCQVFKPFTLLIILDYSPLFYTARAYI